MMNKESYVNFLGEVREATGLESLVPDESGLVSVRVDDTYNVNLQFIEATGKVLCLVGEINRQLDINPKMMQLSEEEEKCVRQSISDNVQKGLDITTLKTSRRRRTFPALRQSALSRPSRRPSRRARPTTSAAPTSARARLTRQPHY